MSKSFRFLAKEKFNKIKKEFIDKHLPNFNKSLDNDPYGEENWEDENDIINKANVYYTYKRISDENMPFLGLGRD